MMAAPLAMVHGPPDIVMIGSEDHRLDSRRSATFHTDGSCNLRRQSLPVWTPTLPLPLTFHRALNFNCRETSRPVGCARPKQAMWGAPDGKCGLSAAILNHPSPVLPILNRPYFPRPRKYRRLFSEPTYWPRHSWSQYGEGNNQAGFFEAEGNMSLIPGRLARSPLTCPSIQKVRGENVVYLCSERCNAGTGSLWPSGAKSFDQRLPPAIVNSQIAQVDRPKILERMVFGSSPPLSGVFVTFSLSNWGLRKFLSLSEVK